MDVKRTRNWMTIVYPESAPADWQQKLSDLCVPAIVSPLHDRDLNPDGTPKKAHWHVMLLFNGVKTFDQVQALCSEFGGVTPQQIKNTVGQARYLIHKDSPEKVQYNDSDVLCFSGADWSKLIMTSADIHEILADITAYMDEKDVCYYDELVTYCRDEKPEWFNICVNHTRTLQAICISKSTKAKELGDVRRINTITTRSTKIGSTKL